MIVRCGGAAVCVEPDNQICDHAGEFSGSDSDNELKEMLHDIINVQNYQINLMNGYLGDTTGTICDEATGEAVTARKLQSAHYFKDGAALSSTTGGYDSGLDSYEPDFFYPLEVRPYMSFITHMQMMAILNMAVYRR
ncbi:hypothetical protein CYMTET_19296 [Cymbomonas tetramitiformis]|uniref:Uncharacterized protein n=1 Tax=Cymbomonas tetramitiformis TaxID=36881 RepID=A0AAE0G6A9_9CHLO|nr:hypothetical protein CYMTET_19296 [Cymbomonas tetramitiformis]